MRLLTRSTAAAWLFRTAQAGALTLGSMSSAVAAEPPAAAMQPVEEILVVGARLPRPATDVIGTVDVVTRETMLDNMVARVSDVVRYIPGVSVAVADSRFGESEFTIRGLSGNRVVQLVDGVRTAPQFDVGAFSNAGQDYLVPDAVARVEILRGPASSLFGSDALGGVVAIVTRDPADYLDGAAASVSASSSYDGVDDGQIYSGAIALGNASDAGVLHVSTARGHESDHGAPGPDDSLDRQRDAALLKFDHVLGAGARLRFRAEGFRETVASDLSAVLGYGTRYRNTTWLNGDDERKRYLISAAYEFSDAGFVSDGRAVVYHGTTDVKQNTHEQRDLQVPPVVIERQFHYQYKHVGTTLDLQSRWLSGDVEHLFGYGLSFDDSVVKERRDGSLSDLTSGATTNDLLGEVMPVRDFPISDQREIGAYLLDEMTLDRWKFVPALRVDRYQLNPDTDTLYREDNPTSSAVDVDEVEWSPKFGVQYAATATTTVYFQYVHGFRAPPFEDVNIGLDIPRFNIRAIPNPDLRAESSDGLEVGLRHSGDRLRYSIALFGADYDNFIETKVNLGPDPTTGVILFQSRNISSARVYGTDVNVELDCSAWLRGVTLGLAANWTHGENRDDHQPLNSVDPAELVARLVWRPNDTVRLAWITTAVAAQDRVDDTNADLFEPDSFVTTDLLASFETSLARLKTLRIDVGVFNVFDETFWRWSSVRNRTADDPLIGTLSAPGRYASVSIHVAL
jgi:hemoglobin/transferrin/lactoferrin receptor protein